MAEHNPNHRLRTNVEFYTAALLHGTGGARTLFTATFAVSRVGSRMAHASNRNATTGSSAPSHTVSVTPDDRGRASTSGWMKEY